MGCYSLLSPTQKGYTKLSNIRESPMRVTSMTKFVVAQAAAEMDKTKQEIIEDVLCAAFPAHAKTYKLMNRGKK